MYVKISYYVKILESNYYPKTIHLATTNITKVNKKKHNKRRHVRTLKDWGGHMVYDKTGFIGVVVEVLDAFKFMVYQSCYKISLHIILKTTYTRGL